MSSDSTQGRKIDSPLAMASLADVLNELAGLLFERSGYKGLTVRAKNDMRRISLVLSAEAQSVEAAFREGSYGE